MSAQEQNDALYLKQLGASNFVVTALMADTTHDTFCVLEKPFGELTENIFAYTTTVSFGANTLKLTLRKTFSDNNWWIDEEGVFEGKSYRHSSLVRFNSYVHFNSEFTYILVSPYTFTNDIKEQIACLANCSFLLRY
jgi:hypothetical protein